MAARSSVDRPRRVTTLGGMIFRTREDAIAFGAARGAWALLQWLLALADDRPWPPWTKDADAATRASMRVTEDAIRKALGGIDPWKAPTPSEQHAAKVGAFCQIIADAEQRMVRIQEGLTERFETSCKKRRCNPEKLRCDFVLTVKLRKPSETTVGMSLTRIVRKYRTEYLARCDWQAEVATILAEGWPE